MQMDRFTDFIFLDIKERVRLRFDIHRRENVYVEFANSKNDFLTRFKNE